LISEVNKIIKARSKKFNYLILVNILDVLIYSTLNYILFSALKYLKTLKLLLQSSYWGVILANLNQVFIVEGLARR
jgi:hypothetical protein